MLPVGTGSLPSLWQGECAPYWFTNTRNSYHWPGQILLHTLSVFHHVGFLRLPSWADQPLMPIEKLQALANTVSRACALFKPVPRADRAAAVPITTEQRLFGHWQAAPGLLQSCAGGKQRHAWEETKSQSPAGARAELLIMPTVQTAVQTCLFGVHLTVTPNQPWYYKLKWRQLNILYLLYQYIVIVGKDSVI